jgi:116 kDa U5 small nuclear ribonucleoprotein component
VLEPVYKIYSQVLGGEVDELATTLSLLGVRLRKLQLKMDPKPLLRLVFRQLLGSPSGFVDMCTRHTPSPLQGAAVKVSQFYTGDQGGPEALAMRACSSAGPLVINVVKLLSAPDSSSGFLGFARVLSGTVSVGMSVRVLGESYSVEDEEEMAVRVISGISIGQARYSVAVESASAGCLVMLHGIDDVINKTATLAAASDAGQGVTIFRPLQFNTASVMNLAVEPLNPSELPKVLAGLRKIQQSYPLARTRVEESGEHVIMSTGELAMDCIMHDLR